MQFWKDKKDLIFSEKKKVRNFYYLFVFSTVLYKKLFCKPFSQSKDLEPITTHAIALDNHKDSKDKEHHLLYISDVESYYNIRTVGQSFELKKSYLALEDNALFPLVSKTEKQKSFFKPIEEIKVQNDQI